MASLEEPPLLYPLKADENNREIRPLRFPPFVGAGVVWMQGGGACAALVVVIAPGGFHRFGRDYHPQVLLHLGTAWGYHHPAWRGHRPGWDYVPPPLETWFHRLRRPGCCYHPTIRPRVGALAPHYVRLSSPKWLAPPWVGMLLSSVCKSLTTMVHCHSTQKKIHNNI
jgi:hypothetical protein